jgi:hypothetical protein
VENCVAIRADQLQRNHHRNGQIYETTRSAPSSSRVSHIKQPETSEYLDRKTKQLVIHPCPEAEK